MADGTVAQTEDPAVGPLKLAELTSTLGAGVIGAAIGLALASYLADFVIPIFGLGLLMHASGMTNKQVVETRRATVRPPWTTLLYWFCWLVLAGMAGYAALRALAFL